MDLWNFSSSLHDLIISPHVIPPQKLAQLSLFPHAKLF